ncbi:MAG TPA: glycosyltransferase family 4 protein, partial [Propionibacteriaceae bacterium]|nr:glycosyltransferase family 4 protein [Propionibacteriaceae bacterium]
MSRPLRVAHVTTIDATLRFMLLAQLRRLRDEGYDVSGISAPGPWAGELENEGIRHVPWPHATRAWDPAADVRAFTALRRIIRAERFDLVHTHNPKPGVLGRIGARLEGVPCVVNTVHGLFAAPGDPARRRIPVVAAERLAARFSDLELYQSEEDLRWARRIGLVDPARSALLGNGVDLSRFDPEAVSAERRLELRGGLGLPEDAVVVGTVGRLVAEKGYGELVRASGRVIELEPGVRFLAVGPGDPAKADALGDDVRRGAGDSFVFTGWREDVRDLLAVMDVFVLASWREGLPRSAIEAAAMARPLILTDIRGCREVARDGREGLLIPPRDSEALADAVLSLVRDADLRGRLGVAARARAEQRFDESAVADRLSAAYRKLLVAKGLTTVAAVPERAGPGPLPARHDLDGLGTVTIRPAREGEEGRLAELHARTYPAHAFLPQLGPAFLRELYRAQIREPTAVALVAEWDGRVIGYTTGLVSAPMFRRRFLRRYGLRAGMGAGSRLARPRLIRRLVD